MSRRCIALAATLLAGSACVTPRSMTLGQMASGVGQGATEVGVFTGVGYSSQTNPPIEVKDIAGDTFVTQDVARGFALPSAEANLSYGFTDRISLNVHGSPAGLEPGVKFTLNKSKVANVALLPALGVGYGSVGTVTLSAGPDGVIREVGPGSTTSFTFLAGLKFLVSHRSGFFFGVGYQLLFGRSLHSGVNGAGSVQEKFEQVTVSTQHQLGASIGMDIAFGLVHLKPEIAFAVAPGVNMTWYTSQGTATPVSTSASGGFAFAFLPGFTLSVATPPRSRGDDDEAADEKRDGNAEEADSDDEDAAPKKRRFRETDDPPKKRRQVEQDDDDEKPKARKKKSDDDD